MSEAFSLLTIEKYYLENCFRMLYSKGKSHYSLLIDWSTKLGEFAYFIQFHKKILMKYKTNALKLRCKFLVYNTSVIFLRLLKLKKAEMSRAVSSEDSYRFQLTTSVRVPNLWKQFKDIRFVNISLIKIV